MTHVRIGWHCELIHTHFDSSACLLLLEPYSMGEKTGDLSSHSRSDATPCMPWASHLDPLAPSLLSSSSAGWAVTLPVLSFLAWLSQSECSSPGKWFIWNLNGVRDPCMHMEQSRTIPVSLICFIYSFISEKVQKTQFFLS